MMERTRISLVVVGLTLAIAGCPATTGEGTAGTGNGAMSGSEGHTFVATLTGEQEPEPSNTTATGTVTLTLNAAETEATFDVTASGLSSPLISAYFGKAPAGQDSNVVLNFTGMASQASDDSLTASGTWPISESLVAELRAGNIYVNITTGDYPDGEIRGQLAPAE